MDSLKPKELIVSSNGNSTTIPFDVRFKHLIKSKKNSSRECDHSPLDSALKLFYGLNQKVVRAESFYL
jgi:hypothetical protein